MELSKGRGLDGRRGRGEDIRRDRGTHKGRLKDYFNAILVDRAENRYIIE
jgi:hypothetical protein